MSFYFINIILSASTVFLKKYTYDLSYKTSAQLTTVKVIHFKTFLHFQRENVILPIYTVHEVDSAIIVSQLDLTFLQKK